ncbi:hypothetical protein CDAR_381101 [Caerostris darwini]|uniref:Uncharacterized protein n=1 Tax=Caerostris darwini TaxID=1538125 RepID=A0AAV4UTD5_9ARAC|nr:hypothetical protein CDAR_381101 [Caerostris darwini]
MEITMDTNTNAGNDPIIAIPAPRLKQLTDEYDTIVIFIARIRQHFNRLMDAGHPLEDMYPAFKSMRTLPPGPLSVDVHVMELLKWNCREQDYNEDDDV